MSTFFELSAQITDIVVRLGAVKVFAVLELSAPILLIIVTALYSS